jgi:hypothetical protein
MRVGVRKLSFSLFLLLLAATAARAQDRPATASNDPRVGLKAGYKDAGTAARGMQLIKSIPKPDGFFDPSNPLGTPTPPEQSAAPGGAPNGAAAPAPENAAQGQRGQRGGTLATPAPPSGLDFANSDLAFTHDHAIMGNFNGFTMYTVEDPSKARVLASVVCPGGQGDVSIYGNLLFMSVEQTRGRIDCKTTGVPETVSAERFRGVRIFDISDVNKPKQVAAIQTCRGSHTHTLVPDPKDKSVIYVYGQGTGNVRSGEELAGCTENKDDANTALFSIDVIQVPLSAPQNAKLVNRPRIFADENTGALNALWKGGNYGEGTQSSRETNQCHDITVFPEVGLAAGACSGNGILLDISDPVHPVRLDAVGDKNFAYWHSATFNNDGTKVIYTDEWGGGTRPRCRTKDPITWGADAIFSIVDKKLKFEGYYKMPAPQTEQENCVAHNGSLIPIPGRDIMVQGWYQGGVSVFDFTDPAHAKEIAFFDRGPLDAKELYTGGYWSAYWYNGHIYGSEIARGLDIFKLTPSEFITQNEIEAAMLAQTNEFNAQMQPKIVWPANTVVAKAYIDQLNRDKAIQPARAKAVTDALGKADKVRTATDKGAAAVVTELDGLATQLNREASSASGQDAARFRLLANLVKERSAKLQ